MQAAADPSRFADAGPAYSVAKFYEVAFNRDRWGSIMAEMQERGIKLPWGGDEEAAEPTDEQREFGVPEADITAQLDVSAWSAAKRAAAECHKTQRQDFGWLLDMPDDLASRILTPESFVLTRWPHRGIAPGLRESSLFEGVDEP
jgi:LmbE family N-acetylglucosaminyl deacetylase